MRLASVCATLLAVALTTSVGAAELGDCKLDQNNFPGQALRGFTKKSQTRYFMEVDGALKNGAEASYERDEAVLNVDMRVVRTTPCANMTCCTYPRYFKEQRGRYDSPPTTQGTHARRPAHDRSGRIARSPQGD